MVSIDEAHHGPPRTLLYFKGIGLQFTIDVFRQSIAQRSGGVPYKSQVKSAFWRFNICFLEILFSLIS